MANVSYETGQIKSAIYGEEVRDAIISALIKVANEGGDLAHLVDEIEATLSEKVRVNTANIKMKADNLFFNEEEKLLYLMSDGVIIGDGIAVSTGGGGGGGGGQSQTFFRPTLVNKLPDRNITTTIAAGVSLEFEYASVDEFGADDGNGVGRIVVGGVTKKTFSAIQGDNTVNITDILTPGENAVQVKVENSEGTVRTLNYTVTILTLSLTTTMAPISSYSGQATVYYTVTGAGDKTVHFILDGNEIDSEVVVSSGRSRSYLIDEQRHGDHILEMWAESNEGGIHLESERIRLSMMWIGVDLAPIIATPFNQSTATEGDTIVIPYAVYDPSNEIAHVTLSIIDGNGSVYWTTTIDKDRSMSESWITNDFPNGNVTFRISCGSVTKNLQVAVEAYTFPISKVTDSLLLEFSADGRNNSETNPATWSYGNISATFDGFVWSQTDGWLYDDDSKAVLRFLPGDTMDIDFTPFATDVGGSGYTIEIEMATHNVRDFDSIVISCMDGGRGFEIKSQKATLFSEQSSVSMLFKEDSHVRISFVVEQKVSTRFIFIYINGVMCGVTQYPLNDNFSQRNPATISIGTDSCGLDLYTIRLYGKELNRREVLDNLICDKPTLLERRNSYNENNILGTDELIKIDKLPLALPTMVIACDGLPQAKGNATECTITYTDRVHQDQSFVASGALVDVQGTTSAKYPIKNFTINLENGLYINGNSAERYPLRPGDIPTNLFCLKVDFASSEGVNNVGLVQLYEDLCNSMGYKTPPQVDNPAIRQGIAGKPIALFWHDTVHNETNFYSKANFNNDKDTPEVFGFLDYPNMEVWDFRNNTTVLTNFQSDDFTGEGWKEDLKSIYPAKYYDTTALQRVFTFVSSHNRANAADETEAAEMLADFKEHFSEYFVTNNMLFYYLFTEFFLMIDSRGKNMHFATFDGVHWLILPYDMDTALGIDNDGKLVFDYWLEDTDSVQGDKVYNAQNSVLWCNVRDAFGTELKQMYAAIRSKPNLFDYDHISQRFTDHQKAWPMRMWNEDMFNKYLKPFIDDGTDRLNMLQGDKSSQRAWWLSGAFKYRDSKYHAGDALTDVILIRGYTDDNHPTSAQNITLTAYAPIYGCVDFASGHMELHRMERNSSYTFMYPLSAGMFNTEIYIHSADQLSDLGDLSPLNLGEAVFSKATKLQRLTIGSSAPGYVNDKLTNLTVGHNELLTELNICNCTVLTAPVDLHECSGIETVLATGSAITGVQLPVGGHVERLELPATITNLTIRNQSNLTTFVMEGYGALSTLRIENTTNVPIEAIINSATNLSRVRLMGIEWNATDNASLAATIARLDTCMGVDQADNTTEKPVIYGRVNVGSLSGELLEHIQDNYPNLVVVVNGVPNFIVYFRNYDGTKLYAQAVSEGGNATDPVTGGQIIAPTRPMDDDGTTYNYNGWGVLPTNIHENKTVTAQYIAAYKVQWVNDDGTVLQTKQVVGGQSTQYTGSTPTKAQTAQYTFAFKEWTGCDDRTTGGINQVTGPRTVTATYTQTVRQYSYTFYAEDRSTVLQNGTVNYGTTVQYNGTAPTKEGYEFKGWSPSNMVITGNTSFYPVFEEIQTVQDVEITDDWETICTNVDNGTYATKYAVGNYKPIDLGTEGTINMQIVAIDNEEGPLVFVAKELLVTKKAMNSSSTNAGGYPATDVMKPYLNDTILPLIPEVVRTHIKPVPKTSYDKTSGGDVTSTEKLWIPSAREIFGGTSYEQNGPVYNQIYKDANSRKKATFGSSSFTSWWLRSAFSGNDTDFRSVYYSGYVSSNYADYSNGVCLGFVLSSDTISDSWEEIASAVGDGTYSTKYAVGDSKIVDLGDQGAISMQIVAMDTDDLADGSGKAPITWVAKQLLVTKKQMNTTGTNANGYPATNVMRPYLAEDGTIWNKLPATLKTLIKPVSKTSYDKTTAADLTSTEKLWIPSAREIFGGTSYEQSGPVYSGIFKDSTSRKRAVFGSSSFAYWWLRSAYSYSGTNFRRVVDGGYVGNYTASISYGVCLGFCT